MATDGARDDQRSEHNPTASDGATRRDFLAGAGAALLGWGVALDLTGPGSRDADAAAPPLAKDEIVVTLLGTGDPNPRPDRFGPATLVEAGGLTLLFDAGRGATIRLNQLRIQFGKGIDAVFLTHYHSDHVNGLPDVWMSGYIPSAYGSRVKPMRLWGPAGEFYYGPTGVSRIARTIEEAFRDDIRIRMADQHVPESATRIETHEFERDGVVFDEAGVRVTAFHVNHGPLIKPAYGYRIDYANRSVTLSGDTKFNENVIKHGTGVDLLVHEVAVAPKALLSRAEVIAIMNHHTSPEDAGIVFSRARPRLAAFTHLTSVTFPPIPPVGPAEIAARAQGTYKGPLVLGEDLMRFRVGETVTFQKWDPQRGGYPVQ